MILKYLIDENIVPADTKQLRQASDLTILVVGPGAPSRGRLFTRYFSLERLDRFACYDLLIAKCLQTADSQ